MFRPSPIIRLWSMLPAVSTKARPASVGEAHFTVRALGVMPRRSELAPLWLGKFLLARSIEIELHICYKGGTSQQKSELGCALASNRSPRYCDF